MSEIRLHLTLTKERGEKLRAICHARGLAASDLVSAWIDSMGADGKAKLASIIEQYLGATDLRTATEGG